MKRTIPTLAAVLALALPSAAQQPRFENARLETRAVGASLERDFSALVGGAAGPVWIGYAARIIPGEHQMCCYSSSNCCAGCRLEGDRSSGTNITRQEAGTVRLEGPRSLWVLFRAEGKRVEKIRTFTEDCTIDAGGLAVYWLTGASPAASVALLGSFASRSAEGKDERRLADSAVAAIAFHDDPAADRALEGFVAAGQPESLRERTAFWLGNARGRRGYEVLRRLAREDSSPRVREKVVFALTQSKEPEAVNAMIDVARNDGVAHVRGQALFWLAQKAGQKATQAIQQAIDQDPETEVKTRAVFALSQLPRDEGVPMLIQVARTNRNPEVRKKAMFWLGQSKDPRALEFFEQILTK